ncbi:MAG: hypothetical protein K2J99_08820 [Lachnospiraceae bacterium]|nr:hypothetical protein [Lachnospiraceae bacterium]
MTHTNGTSLSPSKYNVMSERHVNWHEAVVCAMQIELRDYADRLDFQPEFILGKNNYRIDLLIIKMLSNRSIPKNIARIFNIYNLFEIKGIHSSVTISSYYKTIGYAGLFIDQNSNTVQYTSLDISITFLTFRYPRKLIKHLRKERKLLVEKFSPGIYYINKEIFKIQIIVTYELPPEENLYLRCLTDNLQDISLINRLTNDYAKHKNHDVYTKYLNQLTTANLKTKGESPMICEGLFNLFGTSSAEVIARAKKESDDYYLPKINELSSSNQTLSSQIDYLKNLLRQNNIPFELNAKPDETNLPNQ